MADLRCGHLDLLLMHWPDAWLPGTQREPDTSVTIRQTWCGPSILCPDQAALIFFPSAKAISQPVGHRSNDHER